MTSSEMSQMTTLSYNLLMFETTTERVEVNDTTGASSSSSATGYFYQIEQLTFLWVLFALIVLGNATVLIALTLSKGRKSRMNFFIKNLAAADLCVGLISVLTDIIWKITISWEAGLVACKVIRFLQAVVTYASTYVLVALSIDRYDAITHPMNFSGSWRRARGLVIIAWILSFIFSAPILHFYETAETEQFGTQCWIDFDQTWKWRLYMTLVSLTLFVLPAILIAGCYIVIVVTIWSKGKEMVLQPAATGGGNDTSGSAALLARRKKGGKKKDKESESSCEVLIKKRSNLTGTPITVATVSNNIEHRAIEDNESRRASSRGLIPKAKVKTVKMTFVIIFVFILCWSPYIVFDLLQVYGCIPVTKTTSAVATFIQSLAPLNSAANPIIYCLFSTNAGQNFCSLFCGKRSNNSNSSSNGRNGSRRHGQMLASHNTAQNTRSTNFDSTTSDKVMVGRTNNKSNNMFTTAADINNGNGNRRIVKALVSNDF